MIDYWLFHWIGAAVTLVVMAFVMGYCADDIGKRTWLSWIEVLLATALWEFIPVFFIGCSVRKSHDKKEKTVEEIIVEEISD